MAALRPASLVNRETAEVLYEPEDGRLGDGTYSIMRDTPWEKVHYWVADSLFARATTVNKNKILVNPV